MLVRSILPKVLFAALLYAPCSAIAQSHPHDMSQMPGMDKNQKAQMPGMAKASSAVAEYGSGTSWQPASSPDPMWMTSARGWMLMAHTNVFVTYNHQGGPAGANKLESENWLMLMEQHKLGKASLQFRQMLSAEPFTFPKPGAPELFQTGETYRGAPLIDYQHPHDFFGEISALLTLPLSDKIDWTVYGGPAGEPALGPVAFVHRMSAIDNPAAPLAHHVQDSTHISYGVITTGVRFGRVRAEGSVFNGREPDEYRYNFDMGPLDSWSVRISAAPAKNWTAQYSYGHLTHPEALEPGDVLRQTASVTYNRRLASGDWATTLVYGRNRKRIDNAVQSSYLVESDLHFARRNAIFTRMELVDKDELKLTGTYRIGAFTFGGARDLVQGSYGNIGVGAALTFYSKPVALDPLYGKDPVSLQVFLHFTPPAMKH